MAIPKIYNTDTQQWEPVSTGPSSIPASGVSFTSSGLAVITGVEDVQAALAATDAALADRPTMQEVEDLVVAPLAVAEVTSGTQLSLNLAVPSDISALRIVGVCRSNDSGTTTHLDMAFNNIEGSDEYLTHRITWSNSATPLEAALQIRDTGWRFGNICAAAGADSARFGTVEITMPGLQTSGHRQTVQWSGGVIPTASGSAVRHSHGHGRGRAATVQTIQLRPGAGAFVAGTRFELYAA